MKGKVPIVLSAIALVVAVLGASSPAIAHGVRHALFAHNADKVDGRHANQLVRSAHTSFQTTTAVGSTVELMSTTIKAPRKGFLLVTASTVFTGTGGELIHCGVELNDSPGWISADGPGQSVGLSAGDTPAPCAATFRFPVSKGTAKVSFDAHNDGGGSLSARGGSLTVLYEPFGRAGAAGTPRIVTARTAHDVNG